MKIFIVIPTYNEEKMIKQVIQSIKKEGFTNIIIVDDASIDNTSKIAKEENILLYKHIINRGLGGALNTGITAALTNKADIIVTFDADGQHKATDIKKLIQPIINKEADVVIGSRLISNEQMHFIRRIGNFGLNIITYLLFGVYCTDTQSGLRAFSKETAEKIKIKTNRMEVSSEIIQEIKRNNLKLKEIPIQPIYTDYSMQKGQTHLNAFRIIYKLILRKLIR